MPETQSRRKPETQSKRRQVSPNAARTAMAASAAEWSTAMKEKIYTTKKSGMIAMIGTILLLIFGVYLMIHAAAVNPDQPGIALAAGVLILSFG